MRSLTIGSLVEELVMWGGGSGVHTETKRDTETEKWRDGYKERNGEIEAEGNR